MLVRFLACLSHPNWDSGLRSVDTKVFFLSYCTGSLRRHAAAAAAENTPAIVRSRRGARPGKRYVYFCCKIAQPDAHEAPDPIAA